MAYKLQNTSSGLSSLRLSSSLLRTTAPLRDHWHSRPVPTHSSSREGIFENGFLTRFAASSQQALTGGRSREGSFSEPHPKAGQPPRHTPDESTRLEHRTQKAGFARAGPITRQNLPLACRAIQPANPSGTPASGHPPSGSPRVRTRNAPPPRSTPLLHGVGRPVPDWSHARAPTPGLDP